MIQKNKTYFFPILIVNLLVGFLLFVGYYFYTQKSSAIILQQIDLSDVESGYASIIYDKLQENTIEVIEGNEYDYLLISYGYVYQLSMNVSFDIDGKNVYVNVESVSDENVDVTTPTFKLYRTNADSINFEKSVVTNPYYKQIGDGINSGIIAIDNLEDLTSPIVIKQISDETLPHTTFQIEKDLLSLIDSKLISYTFTYTEGDDYPTITSVTPIKELYKEATIQSVNTESQTVSLKLDYADSLISAKYLSTDEELFTSLIGDSYLCRFVVYENDVYVEYVGHTK